MSATEGAAHVAGLIGFIGFGFMWLVTMIDMGGTKQTVDSILADTSKALMFAALSVVALTVAILA